MKKSFLGRTFSCDNCIYSPLQDGPCYVVHLQLDVSPATAPLLEAFAKRSVLKSASADCSCS